MAKKVITLEMLKAKGACRQQRAKFKATFGESVTIDPIICMMVAQEFEWFWGAHHLLTPPQLIRYNDQRVEWFAEMDNWAGRRMSDKGYFAKKNEIRALAFALACE